MNKEQILEVLDVIGARSIQKGTRNIQCSCFLSPWSSKHKSEIDRRASMGISISDGISLVHCFACEFGGSLSYAVSLLSRNSGVDYSALIKKIRGYEEEDPLVGLDSIPGYDSYQLDKKEDIIIPESSYSQYKNRTHKYILERGLELSSIREWEGGYDSDKKRAVFPVRNIEGKLVGAVGRTVNSHEMKYFNYFKFDKSRFLFGEHKVKASNLIVVEGLLDTISVWQAIQKEGLNSFVSVVGLLGSEPSKVQASKIRALSGDVFLFLDNDIAGRTGQRKLAKLLQKRVTLRSIAYADSILGLRDPDDLMRKGVCVSELIGESKLYFVKEYERRQR